MVSFNIMAKNSVGEKAINSLYNFKDLSFKEKIEARLLFKQKIVFSNPLTLNIELIGVNKVLKKVSNYGGVIAFDKIEEEVKKNMITALTNYGASFKDDYELEVLK